MADRKDRDGRKLPENVIQRKDGTYMWKKSIDGRQYCLYAKTLGEIKSKRNKALGEIEAGIYKGKRKRIEDEKKLIRDDVTLNEWFMKWEKEYRKGKVKESTLQKDHYMYLLYFSNGIGRMHIKEIRQIDIREAFNELEKNGLKRSSQVVCHQVLSKSLESAVVNGLIKKNPADGILKNGRNGERQEKRVLTEQEERCFFEYIQSSGWYRRLVPLFTVGFGTGMRIGEILALTWGDIDFDNNLIHVNKTLYHYIDRINRLGTTVVINSPKTKASIRDVPMLPKVRDALIVQKELHLKSNDIINGYTDFVFVSRNGTVLRNFDINKTLRRIVNGINEEEKKRAEKEGRKPVVFEKFSPHCMRHTFATRCYEKGVREKVTQKILGHNSLQMTMQVYTHTTELMVEDDLKKLE